MRTGWYFVVLLLVLDVTILFQPAESLEFVKISIPTAFALITAAVKLKAILVKVLLGLRAMGVEGFYWRRRRRSTGSFILSRVDTNQQGELLAAWLDLQDTSGKDIEFQLDSCVRAVKFRKKRVSWGRLMETEATLPRKSDPKEYSTWVSGVIGSLTGNSAACQILHEELQRAAAVGELKQTKLQPEDNKSANPMTKSS